MCGFKNSGMFLNTILGIYGTQGYKGYRNGGKEVDYNLFPDEANLVGKPK